jgi:PAS domain S-box-containing protein
VLAVPVMIGDGLCLGALIAADARPREFTAREQELLTELALIGLDQLLLNRLRRNYARKAEVSRRQAEKLREQQVELKRLHKLFENASSLARIGGWEYDVASNRLTWSREVYSIYELPADTPITLDIAISTYSADIQERLRASIAAGDPLEIEVPLVTSNGAVKWVRIISEPEIQDGRPVRFSGTIQDISEQKERQRQLERLAKHDVLTGLANRQLFQDELESAITGADATGGQVALMLIDLDNFKAVNDTFGHDCGDRLLKEFSGRLKRCFRGSDTIARIGGDEFAVVLPGIMSGLRSIPTPRPTAPSF